MRIAFTSCSSARKFRLQPVWDQIAEADPDHLVLLGDSAYYDADDSSVGEVKGMSANDFAMHAYGRLRDQLSQTQFASLIERSTLTTHAIWDDHDFLWNGACGAQIESQPQYAHLIAPTRAAFKAFRQALSERDPSSFPPHPPAWASHTPPPGYSYIVLPQNVVLHLTDGRSFKEWQGKDALLGQDQMQQFERALSDHKDAVHLLSSGLVFEKRSGETWLDCEMEHDRLLALAGQYKILMLSGDIHENRFAQYNTGGRWQMFEATASGAALRTAVTIGELQCNWGLLDIDGASIQIIHSQIDLPLRKRTIDISTWTLRP